MKYILILLFLLTIIACHNSNNISGEDDSSVTKTKIINSAQFDSSINKIVIDYLSLKNNFTELNDSMINFYSGELIKDADSLNFSGFQADSSTAQQALINTQSISAEMQGLLGETNFNGKQKSFYLLSEELFDLLKLVHYNKQSIYRFECATALDKSSASWLSISPEIKNPYQPGTHCGSITDSIKF